MIRFALQSDLDEIVAVSKQFYDEIEMDSIGYRFHEDRIRASYQQGIDRDEHYVLLYVENCQILGIFFFSVRDEHYYFTDKRFAAEIVWHSLPSLPPKKRLKVMMQLFDAGEMYVKSIGATCLYVGLDSRKDFSHTGINKYLENRGYTGIVKTYFKEV